MSLRQELQKITLIQNVSKHKGKVVALAYTYPHSVEWIETSRANELYTCIVHALDFIEYDRYEVIARRFQGVFAGPEFLHYLIDGGRLESTAIPKEGDMVFYSALRKFKHAGIFLNTSSVESKWGLGVFGDIS